MKYDTLSSRINSKEKSVNSLLEKASNEARRISRAIQDVAGTTTCKGVQINGLKNWAIENSCWLENRHQLGEYADRGSENEVYIDFANQLVNKLNDFRYADDNLESYSQTFNSTVYYLGQLVAVTLWDFGILGFCGEFV